MAIPRDPQASKVDINEMLKAQSTTGSAGSRRGGGLRLLPAFMITELALALVLLIGAGLMIESFLRLMAVPKASIPMAYCRLLIVSLHQP
ncbi:MAG: hypothetical protein J2P41_17330 [Blastocatellia bacterium]|nr:hypothetical protein [Blastocatellia bacterium]